MKMTLGIGALLVLVFSLSSARGAGGPATPLVCNVKDFQSRASSNDTAAIQAAVDACSGKGGLVLLPAGNYISGTVRLGSNLTFKLEAGATLNGVRDAGAYPLLSPPTTSSQLLNCRRALLYAEGTERLTIEGPGTIDGNGDFAPWQNVKEAERPMAIFAVQTKGLKIRQLKVRRAAMWAVVLMETENTLVSTVDIDSQIGGTRDGLDLVDGRNIRVDHLSVVSEDDAICLKSGVASGLSQVWVTSSKIGGSLVANGIKFGTASRGPLSDIHFEGIDIEHVAQAAMAIESVDGSVVDGVTFDGIKVHDTGTAFFVLLGWRGDQAKAKPGSISNLTFRNIGGDSSRQAWGSAISGSIIGEKSFAPSHLVFERVHLAFKADTRFASGHLPAVPPEYSGQYPDPRMWPGLPARGLFFRHVKDVRLKETTLEKLPGADARPMMIPETTASEFDAP